MKENSGTYIILEGHCDEVGQSEYNMELGDRRARAVEAYMIEQGIPEERIIMIVSYGSERPLNLGREIKDLRENRRVEFVVR
jgi:peptidoglycan-associated lipoprotein